MVADGGLPASAGAEPLSIEGATAAASGPLPGGRKFGQDGAMPDHPSEREEMRDSSERTERGNDQEKIEQGIRFAMWSIGKSQSVQAVRCLRMRADTAPGPDGVLCEVPKVVAVAVV